MSIGSYEMQVVCLERETNIIRHRWHNDKTVLGSAGPGKINPSVKYKKKKKKKPSALSVLVPLPCLPSPLTLALISVTVVSWLALLVASAPHPCFLPTEPAVLPSSLGPSTILADTACFPAAW